MAHPSEARYTIMNNSRDDDYHVYYHEKNLDALAARTGETVEFYLELLDYMLEEDRTEAFPMAVAKASGLSVAEVHALLSCPRTQ